MVSTLSSVVGTGEHRTLILKTRQKAGNGRYSVVKRAVISQHLLNVFAEV